MHGLRTDASSHPCLSYADGLASAWYDFLLLIGRILLGWIYLQSGWGKMSDIPGFAAKIANRGLPQFLGYMAAPVELFGGLALLLGFATRYSALLVLLFTIVATLSSHAYWGVPAPEKAQQSTQFWKNVSMMGGLVLLFATAGGRLSLDRMLSRIKQ
jgi:putative oxidoreductase